MTVAKKKPKPKPKKKGGGGTGPPTVAPPPTPSPVTSPGSTADVSGSSGAMPADTSSTGAVGDPSMSGDLTNTTQLVQAVFGTGAGYAPQQPPVAYTLQPAPQEAQAGQITAASTAAGAGATA